MLNLIKLKNKGYSLEQILIKRGWKSVAIYGTGSIAKTLYDELSETRVNVNCIINEFDFTSHIYDMPITYDVPILSPFNIGDLPGVDAIIISHVSLLNEVVFKLKSKVQCDVIAVDNIIIDIDSYEAYKKSVDYVTNSNAKLYMLDFSLPTYKVKNPSTYEVSLRSTVGGNDFFKSNPTILEEIFNFNESLSDEYVQGVFYSHDHIASIKDGIFHLTDCNTTYFNVINGRRITIDSPEEYDNTIYFFGSCLSVGYGAEDKNTIESQLQKIINSSKGKKNTGL